jgi:hypothetical protein
MDTHFRKRAQLMIHNKKLSLIRPIYSKLHQQLLKDFLPILFYLFKNYQGNLF